MKTYGANSTKNNIKTIKKSLESCFNFVEDTFLIIVTLCYFFMFRRYKFKVSIEGTGINTMFKIAIKKPVEKRRTTKLQQTSNETDRQHEVISPWHYRSAYHVKSGLKPHTQPAMIKIKCDFRQLISHKEENQNNNVI